MKILERLIVWGGDSAVMGGNSEGRDEGGGDRVLRVCEGEAAFASLIGAGAVILVYAEIWVAEQSTAGNRIARLAGVARWLEPEVSNEIKHSGRPVDRFPTPSRLVPGRAARVQPHISLHLTSPHTSHSVPPTFGGSTAKHATAQRQYRLRFICIRPARWRGTRPFFYFLIEHCSWHPWSSHSNSLAVALSSSPAQYIQFQARCRACIFRHECTLTFQSPRGACSAVWNQESRERTGPTLPHERRACGSRFRIPGIC